MGFPRPMLNRRFFPNPEVEPRSVLEIMFLGILLTDDWQRTPAIGRERMTALRSHLEERQVAARKALNPPEVQRRCFALTPSFFLFYILVVSMFGLSKHTGTHSR